MELPNPFLMAKNLIAENPVHASEAETHQEPTYKIKNGYIFQDGTNMTKPKDKWDPFNPSKSGNKLDTGKSMDMDMDKGSKVGGTSGPAQTTVQYYAPTQQGPAQKIVFQQPTSVGGAHSVGQSPTQSPMQSPIQGPPMKGHAVPVKTVTSSHNPQKLAKVTPQAAVAGTLDGIVDFLSHCVLGHVSFLWKNPTQILTDPVAAIKLNELELNPMGHIKNSIYQAAQRDNPMQQIMQLPMGLDDAPVLKNLAIPHSTMGNGMVMK